MNNEELKDKMGDVFVKLYQTKYMTDIEELCQGENRVLMYLCAADNERIYRVQKTLHSLKQQSIEPDTLVYPSDIAKDLLVSKQRVTSIINSLEKKGFCKLEHSVTDRRRIQVSITKNGKKAIEKKQEIVESYFDFFIENIGKENIETLCEGMNKAINLLIEKEQNGGIQ